MLWLSVLVFVSSGASCPRMMGRGSSIAAPALLIPNASLEQVLAVINLPAATVRQLRSVGARLTVDNAPTLSAEIALERPRRLHITAKLNVSLSSEPEVDLGSNDGQYWMWVRREEVIYTGRHDETMTGAAGQFLPVPPVWIMDALGLLEVAAQDVESGPSRSGSDRLVLQTRMPGRPDLRRTIEIDAVRGLVLTQHLYDQNGRLLVSAYASDHRFIAEYGLSLPHRIKIDLPMAQSEMQLDANSWLINQLPRDSQSLWQMPSVAGIERIELTSPQGVSPQQAVAPATYPAAQTIGAVPPTRQPGLPPRDSLGGINTAWRTRAPQSGVTDSRLQRLPSLR
ncbi:MAG: hypothetical protein O3C60_05500 [Planctomycetota bacterium]|nr:hypothetical protein [Planctomycetota bacterium]